MKKVGNIKSLILLIVVAVSVLQCTDDRKPILSLADLMIVKLTSPQTRKDSGEVLVNKIIELRRSDSTFYKTLFNPQGKLPTLYFYSRPGSCCPCSAGDPMCCDCPPGSGLGDLDGQSGNLFDGKNSVFKFTSIVSPQTQPSTFSLEVTKVDNVNVYTVPKGTQKGDYTATIQNKTGTIDLTLTMMVNEDGTFHITKVQ